MLDPQLVFVTFGTAVGTIATVVVAGMQSPRRWCPECAAVLPQFRIPTSVAEAWRRGWTCDRCSVRIDQDGRSVGN
jgi:hypothetical protein